MLVRCKRPGCRSVAHQIPDKRRNDEITKTSTEKYTPFTFHLELLGSVYSTFSTERTHPSELPFQQDLSEQAFGILHPRFCSFFVATL